MHRQDQSHIVAQNPFVDFIMFNNMLAMLATYLSKRDFLALMRTCRDINTFIKGRPDSSRFIPAIPNEIKFNLTPESIISYIANHPENSVLFVRWLQTRRNFEKVLAGWGQREERAGKFSVSQTLTSLCYYLTTGKKLYDEAWFCLDLIALELFYHNDSIKLNFISNQRKFITFEQDYLRGQMWYDPDGQAPPSLEDPYIPLSEYFQEHSESRDCFYNLSGSLIRFHSPVSLYTIRHIMFRGSALQCRGVTQLDSGILFMGCDLTNATLSKFPFPCHAVERPLHESFVKGLTLRECDPPLYTDLSSMQRKNIPLCGDAKLRLVEKMKREMLREVRLIESMDDKCRYLIQKVIDLLSKNPNYDKLKVARITELGLFKNRKVKDQLCNDTRSMIALLRYLREGLLNVNHVMPLQQHEILALMEMNRLISANCWFDGKLSKRFQFLISACEASSGQESDQVSSPNPGR